MDAVDSVVDPLCEFAKDSVRLIKCCHKPDHKEFTKVAARTAIGFFIKLISIPINNIIVGLVATEWLAYGDSAEQLSKVARCLGSQQPKFY